MSEFEGKPISDRFFKMENDFKLFDFVSDEGLPLWDVLRWDVLTAIKMPSYLKNSVTQKIGFKHKLIKLHYLCVDAFFFIKFLLTPYNFLFLSNRRFKKQGVSGFYDPLFESVKSAVENRKLAHYLINDNYKRGSNKDKVFNIIPILYIIKSKLKIERKNNKAEAGIYIICNIVQDNFGVFIDPLILIKHYKYFLFECEFYALILKLKKIKHVFFVLAGIQKGLIYAAKKNNIPVSELQHGDVVYETTYYLYQPLTEELKNKIICPDNFLLFSDLWVRSIRKNINSNCIAIGNDFFYKSKKEIQNKESIAIISSRHHNDILSSLAIAIAKEKPDLKIYFKLHPNQFSSITQHKLFFKKYNNIEVVSIELNMAELVDIVDEFIAVYTTAMYEILQAGKILYVLKEYDYLSFKDFFDLKNVYLINDSKDFVEKRKITFANYSSDVPVFFERFNKDVFLDNVLLRSNINAK